MGCASPGWCVVADRVLGPHDIGECVWGIVVVVDGLLVVTGDRGVRVRVVCGVAAWGLDRLDGLGGRGGVKQIKPDKGFGAREDERLRSG